MQLNESKLTLGKRYIPYPSRQSKSQGQKGLKTIATKAKLCNAVYLAELHCQRVTDRFSLLVFAYSCSFLLHLHKLIMHSFC